MHHIPVQNKHRPAGELPRSQLALMTWQGGGAVFKSTQEMIAGETYNWFGRLPTTKQLLIAYFCLSAMTTGVSIKQQEGKKQKPGTPPEKTGRRSASLCTTHKEIRAGFNRILYIYQHSWKWMKGESEYVFVTHLLFIPGV